MGSGRSTLNVGGCMFGIVESIERLLASPEPISARSSIAVGIGVNAGAEPGLADAELGLADIFGRSDLGCVEA